MYLDPSPKTIELGANKIQIISFVTTEIHEYKQNILNIIVHQTHYEKSDWSRAFNQFTRACELDMINAISAADIVFIMSSSTSMPGY